MFFHYLLLVNSNPIGGGEPLVVLDVIDSILEVAISLGEVNLEKIAKKILQVATEVRGKPNLFNH